MVSEERSDNIFTFGHTLLNLLFLKISTFQFQKEQLDMMDNIGILIPGLLNFNNNLFLLQSNNNLLQGLLMSVSIELNKYLFHFSISVCLSLNLFIPLSACHTLEFKSCLVGTVRAKKIYSNSSNKNCMSYSFCEAPNASLIRFDF